MGAVSGATVRREYAPLALIHAAAVRRSLACLVLLSPGGVMGIYESLSSRWRRTGVTGGATSDGDGTATPTVAGD
jgi:hypothetical protein